jgi:hypothetical protein
MAEQQCHYCKKAKPILLRIKFWSWRAGTDMIICESCYDDRCRDRRLWRCLEIIQQQQGESHHDRGISSEIRGTGTTLIMDR